MGLKHYTTSWYVLSVFWSPNKVLPVVTKLSVLKEKQTMGNNLKKKQCRVMVHVHFNSSHNVLPVSKVSIIFFYEISEIQAKVFACRQEGKQPWQHWSCSEHNTFTFFFETHTS